MRPAAWMALGLSLLAGSARAEESAPAAAKQGEKADKPAPPAPEKGAATEKLLKGVKADGPLELPEVVQADLLSMMPTRRSDECAVPARVAATAYGLKDRGDGPALVARVVTCKGGMILAVSPGVLLRIARLLDLDNESLVLQGASLLNLRGGKREEDLALTLSMAPYGSELRVLLRRDDGFAFSVAGRVKDTAMPGECTPGSDDPAGWASYLKTDAKSRLMVLRVDLVCGGAPSAASCTLWGAAKGDLSTVGVCPLPPKLDQKSLRGSGWR